MLAARVKCADLAKLPLAPVRAQGLIKPGPEHHKLCVACMRRRDVHLQQRMLFGWKKRLAVQLLVNNMQPALL